MPHSTPEKRRAYQARRVKSHPESVYSTRRKKQAYVTSFKAERGCADCGEMDVIVLELDHRDPSTKDARLRAGKRGNNVRTAFISFSWADLLAELEKCDVVCANCHRRRTAVAQGWAVSA